MSHGPRVCAQLALVLVLPAAGAGADDPAPAKPTFGEEIVVVGSRPRGASADPTGAATIVAAKRFAGEAKTVADLVSTSPGVAVNQYGGLGQLATVSIRGSTADQVQVYLDGLPLHTAAGGGVDLSRIPRQWIERIEVLRGAEGAHFGAGALGGVLNVITRRAARGSWALEASGGSFGTASASAEAAAGGARWGTLAALALDATGGRYPYDLDATPNTPGGTVTQYRVSNGSASAGFLGKLWADAGEGRLDAVLQLSGGRREIPGNAFALTRDDAQRDGRAGLVLRYAQPLGPALLIALEGTARADRLDLTSQAVGGTLQQRGLAGGATARLSWSTGPHALSAAFAAGAERLESPGTGARARPELALAVGDDVDLLGGRLRLAPAVRADRGGAFTGLSAKLGASAHLAGPLSARASGGRTFRAPSFAELFLQQGLVAPNPGLGPEEAWSADAALVVDGPLGMASAGGFATLYRDVIVYLQALGQRVKPFNAGEAAARGLEAELATAPAGPAALQAQLAYTFLDTETLRGGPQDLGKQLPHRARHRLFARLAVAPEPFEAHVEAQYVGAQFRDLRNEASIPAAFLLHAGVATRVLRRPDLSLHLELRNLLDDRALTDGFSNPLPGRMVMLTLRVTGGKDAPP